MEHSLSDKISISGGRELGFSLEQAIMMLQFSMKCGIPVRRDPAKQPVAEMVCARMERTLQARKTAR